MARQGWSVWGLGAAFLVLGGGSWRLAATCPELDAAWVGLMAMAWGLALACASRVRVPTLLLLGSALLLRLAPFCAGPVLSDDVQRYVWEGAVLASGANPYRLAPADPALEPLRLEHPELHARVAHPEVGAVYPPLAQVLHAGVFRALGRPAAVELGLRLVYAVADLLLVLVLARWLARRGRSPTWAVAWGWCPFVLFEFAGSGHLDSLALLLVVWAWSVMEGEPARGARLRATLGLSAATLVKWLPAVFLVRHLLRLPRGGRLGQAALALAVLAAGIVPFLLIGGLGTGLGEYAARWEGFNVLFRVARSIVEACSGSTADPLELAERTRWIVSTLAALVVLACVVKVEDATDAARWIVWIGVLCAPVLHPWYLAWLLPFVALRGDRAAIWLCAVAPLLYAPLAGWQEQGTWIEAPWTWPLIVPPLLVLLVLELRRARPRTP